MRAVTRHIEGVPEEWQSTNDWDSHRPLLFEAIQRVAGNVYEFGCGDGSTSLLTKWCSKRRFFSFETNLEWADKFINVVPVFAYSDICAPIDKLGVLFIDSAPADTRPQLIQDWRNLAQVIVVHDTEIEAEYVYGMKDILSTFKYRLDYQPEGKPHTTAVSNTVNVCTWI